MVLVVLPGLNPQRDDAKFLGFSKDAEDGPSRAGGTSEKFPEVPIEFCVFCGKPESWLSIPLGLGFSTVGWERVTL